MTNEALALVEKLAETLGTTTEFLWGVLVVQARVESVSMIVGFLVAWTVLGLVYYVAIRPMGIKVKNGDYEPNRYDPDLKDGWLISLIVWSLLLGASLVALLCVADTIISGFINPNYYALEKVLEVIR